jgi:uncharacterized membrane protein
MADTVIGVLVLVTYFFIPIHVFMSPRSYGSTKIWWLISVLIFSWLAYGIFLYATREDKKIVEGGW